MNALTVRYETEHNAHAPTIKHQPSAKWTSRRSDVDCKFRAVAAAYL